MNSPVELELRALFNDPKLTDKPLAEFLLYLLTDAKYGTLNNCKDEYANQLATEAKDLLNTWLTSNKPTSDLWNSVTDKVHDYNSKNKQAEKEYYTSTVYYVAMTANRENSWYKSAGYSLGNLLHVVSWVAADSYCQRDYSVDAPESHKEAREAQLNFLKSKLMSY